MAYTKQIFFSMPAILIATGIFVVSNGPIPGLPQLGLVWEDKILHTFAYFIFGLAVILFFIANLKNSNIKKIIIITLIVGSIYGASDEIHQMYVPGRSPDILDWVADVVGISLSIVLLTVMKNFLFKVRN